MPGLTLLQPLGYASEGREKVVTDKFHCNFVKKLKTEVYSVVFNFKLIHIIDIMQLQNLFTVNNVHLMETLKKKI
jgi:hypothetical protein